MIGKFRLQLHGLGDCRQTLLRLAVERVNSRQLRLGPAHQGKQLHSAFEGLDLRLDIFLVLKQHSAKMILHQAIFRKLASGSIEDSRGFCGRPREPRDDSASGASVFGVGIVPARSIGLTFCRQQQVAAMNRKSRHVGLRRLTAAVTGGIFKGVSTAVFNLESIACASRSITGACSDSIRSDWRYCLMRSGFSSNKIRRSLYDSVRKAPPGSLSS